MSIPKNNVLLFIDKFYLKNSLSGLQHPKNRLLWPNEPKVIQIVKEQGFALLTESIVPMAIIILPCSFVLFINESNLIRLQT